MTAPNNPVQAGKPTVGAGKAIPVILKCDAPKAQIVTIAGDFNDWDTERSKLKKNMGGLWEITLKLTHGRHRYVYVVDGECVLDPNAHGAEKTDEGYKTSMLFVS
ncbi:MAG: 1,4-alpha-glucan branching enzyme [Candidatus Binatia bacterium]|jgi:1,4-alpha-glucan branching enzyme|tara:strand:- start:253 stop:567 length:315 start_codon:yes stop_codon:yes gene_type:complete